jgi:DNA mismatch endonuclease (patch repair protein)
VICKVFSESLTDTMSKRARSRLMSKIRSEGTKPELLLRRLVRAASGRSLRYNVRTLPGSPDVVVHSLKIVIFAEGCLWHRCPVHFRMPKSNVAFWEEKIRKNVLRDRKNRAALRLAGWTVWRVWEHDLRPKHSSRTLRNLRKRFFRAVALLSDSSA